MLDRIFDYFLAAPGRLVTLGKSMLNVAAVLVLAAAVAHAATLSVSVVRGMAGGARADVTLAELLPEVPTWWVPEGALGLCLAVMIAGAGAVVLRTGRMYERLLR